jgi:two-component system chemotaxis sensor kinase CheA
VAAPVLSRGKYAALFAAESRDQLARAARAAAGLRAGGPPALLDEAFRAVHTIKGMAAAMGYAASEAAADAAEHRLGVLRAAAAPVAAADADAVVAFVDALEGAVDADTSDPAATPPNVAAAAATPDGGPAGWDRGAARGAQPVRVDAARLDALLDLTGELAAARGRLAAAVAHAPDPALARAVQDVTRVAQALQAAVVEARLVPLAELFDRLPRVTREAARAAGREVAFEAAGGDAAVDRGVLDALGEPLTHLLRNAVDHGVEPPAVRVAAGKPAAGRVRVAAERVPGGVIVTVEDDGRGVDRAAVLAAARRRGAVPRAPVPGAADPAADQLDDAALLDLLARPGLTTAAAVTRVSGRGVGVDAALARVRALGGTLTLDTRAGQGTRFTLRVPLTLAVTPVLLVRAGGRPYALPLAHVRATREPAAGDRPVPLTRLLGVAGAEDDAEPGDVVLLDAAGRAPVAAGVDRVEGQADCVVKALPRLRGAFRTASTATILDAGEVALVLDVPALVARSLAPAPR